MNAILGFSEALYHKLDSRQHQKMIKSVLNSGNLLLSLLNDILDLSKIEAGKIDIFPQPVDLNHILEEIYLLYKDKAQKKGLAFDNRVSDGFPHALRLDEIRIKQVLFNLVGNAIKFTHNGYVSIGASVSEIRHGIVDLELTIEDTGIGIPDSQIDQVFEAFRQQSGQSNRQYGGAGLGLAISKRLIEKMNGSICISSKVNKGSLFTVTIREVEVCGSEIRNDDVFEEAEHILFEDAVVLVVDDVSSNISTVEQLLSSSGLTISSAESGEIALEILNHSTPDLILLDLRMPGINGYDVARRIKENPKQKQIPIIAFTASVFNTAEVEASEYFDDFLFKPVRRAEIIGKLARFLRHKKEVKIKPVQKSRIIDLEGIPDNLREKLPEVHKIMKERFLPKWEDIKDTLVLFKMEDFAYDLKQMAEKYGFQLLTDYSNELIEALDLVDLETLRDRLFDFPKIIQRIEDHIKK